MRRPPKLNDRMIAARRKKRMAFGSLLGLLAIVWARNVVTTGREASGGVPGTTEVIASPAAAKAPAMERPVELAWPAASSRDPFVLDERAYAHRPRNEKPEPKPRMPEHLVSDDARIDAIMATLVLQATMLSEDPKAVINGRTFRVGEEVNGLVVRRIEIRRVVLARNGIERVLVLTAPGSRGGGGAGRGEE